MNLNLSEQQQLLAILILVLSMGIALGYFISRYANKKQFLKFAQDQKETVSSLNNSMSYSEQLKQKIQSKEKDIAVLLERVKHLSSVNPLVYCS